MKPVSSGQRLQISASEFNRMQRATEAVESAGLGNTALGVLGNGEIWVRNQWAYPLLTGDRVGIDGPIFYQLPTEAEDLQVIRERRRLVYAVDKPKWPINQRVFATLLEPLQPQGIGRALVTGVAPAYVDKDATYNAASGHDMRFVTPHMSRTANDDKRREAPWVSHSSIEIEAGRSGASAPIAQTIAYTGHAAQVLDPIVHEHSGYNDLADEGVSGNATVSCVDDRWQIIEEDCAGISDTYRTIEYDTATFPYPCDGLTDRVIPCRNLLDTDRRLVDVVHNNETQFANVGINLITNPTDYRANDDWCGWRQCIYACQNTGDSEDPVYEHVLLHSECRQGEDVGSGYEHLTCGCRAIEYLPAYRICDALSEGAEFRMQCEAQTFTTTPPPTTQPPTTQPPTTQPPTTQPPTTAPPCTGGCVYTGDRSNTYVDCGTFKVQCQAGFSDDCADAPGYAWVYYEGGICRDSEGNSTDTNCRRDWNYAYDAANPDPEYACYYYELWEFMFGVCGAGNSGAIEELPCEQDTATYNYFWRLDEDNCVAGGGSTCYCDDSELGTAGPSDYGDEVEVSCGTTPTTTPPTTQPPPTTSPPSTLPPTTTPAPTTAPPTTAPPTTTPAPTTAPPNPMGACCVLGACSYLSLSDCDLAMGFHYAGATCAPSPCGSGACCDGATCVELSEAACEASYGPGNYQGDGTDCSPNPCA